MVRTLFEHRQPKIRSAVRNRGSDVSHQRAPVVVAGRQADGTGLTPVSRFKEKLHPRWSFSLVGVRGFSRRAPVRRSRATCPALLISKF